MLGELPGQIEHRGGHRRRCPADGVHRPVIGRHDPGGELPGDGRGDQAQRWLQRLPQRVIRDEPARVGVIGGDDRVTQQVVTRLRAIGGTATSGTSTATSEASTAQAV